MDIKSKGATFCAVKLKYGGLALTYVRKLNGQFIMGRSKPDFQTVSKRALIPLDQLTPDQKAQILDGYKATMKQDAAFQASKDSSLRQMLPKWYDDIDAVTFEDVVERYKVYE